MIAQGFLDYVSMILVGLVNFIPPLPAEVSNTLASMQGGAAQLGAVLVPFGVLIPFDTLGAIVSAWLALVTFWSLVLGARLLFWFLGR